MPLARTFATVALATAVSTLGDAIQARPAAAAPLPPPAVLVQDSTPAVASVQDSTPALRITFLDVGQADAVLIQAPEGPTALVDAGRRSPTDTLRALGVEEIDLLVATHAHADHIGGMADVLREFPVRYFMDNGMPHTTRTYQRLMEEVERRPDLAYLIAQPRTVALGAASIEVLPMPPPRANDQNNRSVTLVVRYGRFSTWLSGDSEERQLNFLTGRSAVPPVTVLKAPHHGGHTGFTPAFLQAARPEAIVISVGENNQYGHPRPQALAAFFSATQHVYRTDQHGTVTILGFPDGEYRVDLEDSSPGAPPPSSLLGRAPPLGEPVTPTGEPP